MPQVLLKIKQKLFYSGPLDASSAGHSGRSFDKRLSDNETPLVGESRQSIK